MICARDAPHSAAGVSPPVADLAREMPSIGERPGERLATFAARGFATCSRAATAVEFALVVVATIPVILFIMIAGLILYYNQALDYATSQAARQVMIGAVQKAGTSQSAFQAQVCSYLPAVFNCSNVIVNVQTATEAAGPNGYYTYANANQTGLIVPALSNASAQFAPGLQGSYEYIQVIYPITFFPKIFSPFFGNATYQGSPAYLAMSTAAFRNEQY